ncbi:MAG: nuclear transport factor 2 family protein [Actinomycetota bacterium]
MGTWSRQEIEGAFEVYKAAAAKGGASGDWNDWADRFTEDATYIEHLYGTMLGREAIRAWINETMNTFPGSAMPTFPVDWHIVDEERGWIVCQIQNRMQDPGDGSIHQEYNFTLLKYAGDGLFSYEEDVYNPTKFQDMIKGWTARRRELEG